MIDKKPPQIGKLKSGFYLFGRGAIFGAIAIFLVLATFWFVFLPLTGFWHLDISEASLFLIGALLGGIILGLPVGGVGGFILGSIWKHGKSASIGGIILALVMLITVFFLIPCPFLGGC
jgi:hypothetical protein